MKTIIKIIFLIFICNKATAQTTFQKTYGGASMDVGYSVQQTMDGGYIITGTTNSYGSGLKDVYLIKTNSFGDTLFTKTYGMTSYTNDIGVFVRQTTDKGYIIIGYFDANSAPNAYLIKTDSLGNGEWSGMFDGAQGGQSKGKCVLQTNDGGYIFTGYTEDNATAGSGISLIKTDSNGILLWNWICDAGNSNEEGHSIKQTADGGYIITGEKLSFVTLEKDVFLLKTDNGGVLLWSRTYGGLNNENGNSVEQTTDGGYIIAGTTNSFGSGQNDIFVIKTSAIGNILWTKTYGGTGNDSSTYIQRTTDGGYIIAGSTTSFGAGNSDVYLIKIDSVGIVTWSKTFGTNGDEYGYSAQQTIDGGYIITGSSGAINPDIYLIKTDANGNTHCNEGNPTTITTLPPTIVDTALYYSAVYPGPSGISPPLMGSGGNETTICFTSGINEIENKEEINIYPNPATNEITIETKEKGIIKIYNVLGEMLIETKDTSTSSVTIDVSGLAKGIYFMEIKTEKGIINKKIIKE